MKTLRKASAFSLLVLATLGFTLPAFAHEESKFQIVLRAGQVSGNYNGVFSGSFKVDLALDLGVEYFTSTDTAVIVRFVEALDSPDSVPFYTYMGSGQKFYLSGRGPYNVQSDKTTYISARPKLRYYAAWELGVAQVIVKTFGPVIQSVANMAELGANVGAIYQITDNFGIDAQIGGTLGFGISSTSVNGSTTRFLAGISHFF